MFAEPSRPVMMASATILGMIPLLPDTMFGLIGSIMGGLLFGTLITLLFILFCMHYSFI